MNNHTPAQDTTNPSPTSFIVKHPFHSDSPGDCIIQTPDGTQFVVYRVILSLASSVWNDMFSLPQSAEQSAGEHPVIAVDEDPETMEALLTMLYPMQPPQIKSYDLAIRLVQACDKYFIDTKRLATFLHDILRTSDALEKDPLGLFSLAWRLKMEEEIKLASRYTHRLDLQDPKVVEDLMRRTGGIDAVLALWNLRGRREAALDAVAELMEMDENTFRCRSHSNHSSYIIVYTPSTVVALYLRIRSTVKEALNSPYPVCKSLQDFFGHSIRENSSCEDCMHAADRRRRELIATVLTAIEKYPQSVEWSSST